MTSYKVYTRWAFRIEDVRRTDRKPRRRRIRLILWILTADKRGKDRKAVIVIGWLYDKADWAVGLLLIAAMIAAVFV
ncbi:MAG: hypothetical protein EHM13_00630 [Acidobacteria bacterium]|nr:MAG: hypothetical protein EHM13_00630 [Acidobacteriota bacterium]